MIYRKTAKSGFLEIFAAIAMCLFRLATVEVWLSNIVVQGDLLQLVVGIKSVAENLGR